jgi:type II secretory pathway component PulC
VLGLRDPRMAAGPVRPGDIVERVNGRSIERPESFIEAWESLRFERGIEVQVLREGRRLRYRWTIVEDR